MSLAVLCAPCQMGDHDHHDAKGTTRPGLIGGHYCPCPGGCEPQPNPLLDALAGAIERARATRVTPPGKG